MAEAAVEYTKSHSMRSFRSQSDEVPSDANIRKQLQQKAEKAPGLHDMSPLTASSRQNNRSRSPPPRAAAVSSHEVPQRGQAGRNLPGKPSHDVDLNPPLASFERKPRVTAASPRKKPPKPFGSSPSSLYTSPKAVPRADKPEKLPKRNPLNDKTFFKDGGDLISDPESDPEDPIPKKNDTSTRSLPQAYSPVVPKTNSSRSLPPRRMSRNRISRKLSDSSVTSIQEAENLFGDLKRNKESMESVTSHGSDTILNPKSPHFASLDDQPSRRIEASSPAFAGMSGRHSARSQ
jgi:hypothetical protein